MKRCLDEGTLQSYLDGELSPERHEEARAHVAACTDCAEALAAAETELSMFDAAFAGDPVAVVPSEQLRARIEAAIDVERRSQAAQRTAFAAAATPERRSLRAWLAALVAPLSLSPAGATAFAGLAALVVFGAVFIVFQSRQANRNAAELAQNHQAAPATASESSSPQTIVAPTDSSNKASDGVSVSANGNEVRAALSGSANAATTALVGEATLNARVKYTPRRTTRAAVSVKSQPSKVREANPAAQQLPGEEKYLASIASLEKTIKAGGDLVLRPSVRTQFERNVAVVDEAISASRRNALRHPKDAEAAKFLFSAYQSKIELMSTVAERAQFASLNR